MVMNKSSYLFRFTQPIRTKSSSDFAVALCEEAVEFMLTDSGLFRGCSSLFSPLFLLNPFDSVLSFFSSTVRPPVPMGIRLR